MSFVSAGVERTQSTLCVCVCDTSEMNLFLYMKTRATYALVFCCFPSFSAGLTTDGTEKACPFCTDWIPISDWETVGPSLSIFQQQTSPIFFFSLSLRDLYLWGSLSVCTVSFTRLLLLCYARRHLVILYRFPPFYRSFLSVLIQWTISSRMGENKISKAKMTTVLSVGKPFRFHSISATPLHIFIQLIQLCLGHFSVFFLLETSFFLFKYSLPQEKLFPYWNYCESTFGEMNSRSWCRTRDVPRLPVPNWWRRNREEEEGKEKVRQKRKKENKRTNERRGGRLCVCRASGFLKNPAASCDWRND